MLVCTHCRIALRENETQCPRDGHAGEEASWPELPAALAERFTVVEPFARGTSGTLWLVDDQESGRRALLKLLHPVEGLRPADRQRMRREWTKQSTLDSPHLARLYESGDADGQLWCLREWVEGVSLAARLAQGPLSAEDTLALSGALAAGLDALHRAGLLHRDVKPGHIVLQPQPGDAPLEATLIDAGCPTSLSGPGGERLWGTPAYLAPEQSAGKLVSFRSDLYSLGCVLYEAFEGAPPFTDEDAFEVIRMHREHDAPAPPEGLPADLAKLLTSLLAKEPQRRPFSAQKVRKTLAPHVPGKPEKAATATFATHVASTPPPPAGGRSVPPPPPPSKAPPGGISKPPPSAGGRPSAAPGASAPPPVPGGASHPPGAGGLRSHRPQGSVPPPPPPSARPSAAPASDATQPVELEQVVAVAASLSAPPPVPGASSAPESEHTQPVELDQIVAVNEHFGEAKPASDGTQPIDLDELETEAEGSQAEAEAAPPPEAESETDAAAEHVAVEASAEGGQGAANAEDVATEAAEPASDDDAAAPEAGTDDAGGPPGASLPAEATRPSAHLQVRLPEEEPRPAEGLIEEVEEASPETAASTGAPPQAPSRPPQPNFVDALAGPDMEDEEDDNPTHVVAISHVAGAMRSFPSPAAATPGSQPAPPASWDDAEVAGGGPDAASEEPYGSSSKRPARPSEATQVIPNPFSHTEQRNRLLMVGGGAVALLLLLIWAFSGDDEPEVAVAEGAAQPNETAEEAAPAATAAEREPEPPAGAAMAEAPSTAPIVEPMVEQVEPDAEEGASEGEEPEGEDAAEAEEDALEAEEDAPQGRAGRAPSGERKPRRAKTSERKRSRSSKPRRGGGIDKATWERARAEARAHYRHRKYARAESAYEEAAGANPRHAGTFAGLGASRLAQGKNRQAVKAYRHAVELEPRNAAFHAALGHAYAQAGNKRQARASYQKALSLDRRNKAAKVGLERL